MVNLGIEIILYQKSPLRCLYIYNYRKLVKLDKYINIA